MSATSARFFDVVILGMRPGALACAALLARRDFRVLVLGDGHRPATYRYDGLPLRRRAFSHLAAPSPAYRRVIAELAQSQAFRRKLRPLDPMLQLLDGKQRLDLPPDAALFGRELDRELPLARATIEELYVALSRLNARVDEVLEQDAVWPPGTFWERRETNKLRDQLPDARESLAVDAAYRGVVEITARFASHLASGPHDPLPALATARLHGAWSRGVFDLPGDEDELVASLVDRIRAHGGDVRPDERCEAILHKRGKVTGVVLDGDGETTGCAFVIGDRPAARLYDRVRDLEAIEPLPSSAFVARRRFVVSIVTRAELVPPPLAHHSFLRPKRAGGLDVHLQRATFTQAAVASTDPALAALDAELWAVEALLDDAWMPTGMLSPSGGSDLRAREAVLQTLRDHFPFLDRHALVIDSPHDGGPIFDARDGTVKRISRNAVRATGGWVDPEPAEPQYRMSPDAYAEIGGEPIRTSVENLLTVSPAVVPALGTEGELVAAWGAARLVTRTDRRKEKMRREMWSKIEI